MSAPDPSRWPLVIFALALLAAPTARMQAPDAAQLFAEGRDEAALAACDARLAEKPDDAAAIELRARCLEALGRFEEAAAALRALPRRPMAVDLLLARCLASTKDGAADADAILARWATADPDGAALRLARARVHLVRRRAPQALADVRFVQARAPKLFEAQLLMARCAEASGRPDECKRLLEPLLQEPAAWTGGDVHLRREAVAALASASVRLQDYEGAIERLSGLVEESPKVAAWRAQYATALALRHRYADAIAQWEQAVALAPGDAEMRWRLADLYRSHGRIDEAIEQFQAMLASGGLEAVAELRLAEVFLEREQEGDLAVAREHVERAAALSPESGDVLFTKGRILERQGELEAAAAAHRDAFAKNPLRFEALYRLALLQSKSADEAERAAAAALLERYRRIEPWLDELKRGKQDVDVNPANPAALTRMAGLLNLAGEYDHARRWAERSEKLDPRSFMNRVQTGYILANLGDLGGARRSFETALALLPPDQAGSESATVLRGYLDALARGQPLPLPLGQMDRR